MDEIMTSPIPSVSSAAPVLAEVPRPRVSPRDVFLHLLAVGMLYTTAISFLALIYQYIDLVFPDAALDQLYSSGKDFIDTQIRIAVSTLLVAFPVYIGTTVFLFKEYDRTPEKRHLWVRRWLSYLTLFVAAVTIIVSLMTLIYNVLGGELAWRFGLKVVAVLFVAVSVFAFYFWDLRRHNADQ